MTRPSGSCANETSRRKTVRPHVSVAGERKAECEVSPLEERLLCSSEAPIALLKKIANRKSQIANSTAPNNPCLGVVLPYTPLHHLLMVELGFPVVATSGNLSDEPICTDEREALERLGGIADFFSCPQSSHRPAHGRFDCARDAGS